MIKYEIREICGDWALYEVRETETEGGVKCLLILNSRSNAEYVKAILEHELRYPNAAVRYFPRAELMSDAEVLAVFRMCATDEVGACDKCPLKGRDVCREEINRRVLEMAEKYLKYGREIEFIHDVRELTRKHIKGTLENCEKRVIGSMNYEIEQQEEITALREIAAKYARLKRVLSDPLIIDNTEVKGKLRPIKNTSKQLIYRTILKAQMILELPGRWWPGKYAMKDEGEARDNENL